MQYLSTRGGAGNRSFTDVMMDGLAPDGGLYVPQTFQQYQIHGTDYNDIAFDILKRFAGDDVPDTILKNCIKTAYDPFRDQAVTPLKKLDKSLYILELFHGPTLAFKDVALQLLGQLFDQELKKTGKKITIIGATSGDTGSAAIEAIKNCDNIRIFILHPHNRTSDVQRKQMTSIKADNVFNIAIEGSFDDCQNIVKDLFNIPDFRAQNDLSAINSINWARIAAQCVYYAVARTQIDAPQIRFAVPTGNFGNVYAAYVMRQMGLPIEKLIIGSNKNDILTRFFESGVMETHAVDPSLSPSMDIQISSNIERFLFDLFDRNIDTLCAFMNDFKQTGHATISPDQLTRAHDIFAAYRCDDAQTLDTIKYMYDTYNYLCDPHTAVGLRAALSHGLDSHCPTVALACAHPAKFPEAVKQATGMHPDLPDFLANLMDREEHFTILPADTSAVQDFVNKA